MSANLPPGVRAIDIPGNRTEDDDMHCAACGAVLALEDQQCEECGEPIPERTDEE